MLLVSRQPPGPLASLNLPLFRSVGFQTPSDLTQEIVSRAALAASDGNYALQPVFSCLLCQQEDSEGAAAAVESAVAWTKFSCCRVAAWPIAWVVLVVLLHRVGASGSAVTYV